MREPDKSGIARAWKIDSQQPEVRKAHVEEWGYEASSLCDYIINGPYHPLWNWWYIGLVHLREIPGAPPPNKQRPDATHELLFMSLNPGTPEEPITPDIDKIDSGNFKEGLPGFLSPPDLVYQFHGINDDQAIKIVEFAVDHIVAGQSCDSDFRRYWTESLDATAEHYRQGIHQ